MGGSGGRKLSCSFDLHTPIPLSYVLSRYPMEREDIMSITAVRPPADHDAPFGLSMPAGKPSGRFVGETLDTIYLRLSFIFEVVVELPHPRLCWLAIRSVCADCNERCGWSSWLYDSKLQVTNMDPPTSPGTPQDIKTSDPFLPFALLRGSLLSRP